jgi:MinD superfamily P-loop ATPase
LLSLDDVPLRAVFADADVDASNLGLVLAPRVIAREAFRGGLFATINWEICAGCGLCSEVCRFDAISASPMSKFQQQMSHRYPELGMSGDQIQNLPWVDPVACDGCAACFYQCPEGAISMNDQIVGEWYRSESRYGPLFHAALRPAQENSGKLVTLVKQQARLLAMDEDYDLVMVDGPPGIGCPVIAAASGADLALVIAEPTASGMHDLQRVLETTNHFNIRALVCINKADIYPAGSADIKAFCQDQGIQVVGKIPFDLAVTEAMVHGQPVTSYAPGSPSSKGLREVLNKVEAMLQTVGGQ